MPLKLQKRKGVYWIMGSLLGERVRESTRTSDRTLAQQILVNRSKGVQERYIHGPASTFTFADAADYYTLHNPPRGKSIKLIANLVKAFGKYRVTELSADLFTKYIEENFKEGVSPATLKRNLYGPIKAIVNMAVEKDLCPPIKLPKLKIKKKIIAAAPDDEIAKLLSAPMDNWLRAILLTLTYHGTRPTDLQRLTWRDISFSCNTIMFGTTKNGDPHCPEMHPEVREAYLAWFNEVNPWQGREKPVFPRIQGNEPATQINKFIRTVCKRNEIPYYSTHKIGRHAFAERIIHNGYTLKELQEAGNWKSYAVVADRYAHLEKKHSNGIVTSMRIGQNGNFLTHSLEEVKKIS